MSPILLFYPVFFFCCPVNGYCSSCPFRFSTSVPLDFPSFPFFILCVLRFTPRLLLSFWYILVILFLFVFLYCLSPTRLSVSFVPFTLLRLDFPLFLSLFFLVMSLIHIYLSCLLLSVYSPVWSSAVSFFSLFFFIFLRTCVAEVAIHTKKEKKKTPLLRVSLVSAAIQPFLPSSHLTFTCHYQPHIPQ